MAEAARLKEPRPLPASADLAEAISRWLQWLDEERRASAHTVRAYSQDVARFLEFLARHKGGLPTKRTLADAKISDFRSFLAARAAVGVGVSSRGRELSGLRSLYEFLDRAGDLHNAAIGAVATPKKPRGLPKPLSVEQAAAVLDGFKEIADEPWVGLRDRALACLMWGCGLRLGEALSLTCGTAPSAGVVQVLGKGRKTRRVPVVAEVEAAVEAYRRACPYPEIAGRPLFLGVRGGSLDPAVAEKRMRQVRALLGLPETATPHALRHSFATHLLAGGGELRAIQEMMGHATLSTTQRYTEIDQARLAAVHAASHPRAKR